MGIFEILSAIKLGVELTKEINSQLQATPKEKRKEKKAAVKKKLVASVKSHASDVA